MTSVAQIVIGDRSGEEREDAEVGRLEERSPAVPVMKSMK